MQSNLQLAGDFTRGMTAVLHAIAGIFNRNGAYFSCNCGSFFLQLQAFLPANAGVFACQLHAFFGAVASVFAWKLNVFLPLKSRQVCMLVSGKLAWVPHVKVPVKNPLHSDFYRQLQAIRLCSARGVCRGDAEKFICFYR